MTVGLPPALNSLKARIRNAARADGRLARRYELIVADAAIGQVLPPGVVKGGAAMQIRLGDVAAVEFGARIKRGDAGSNGQPAVIMSVQKQPGASTIELTEKVDNAMRGLQATLPPDVEINTRLFRQSNFIEASIGNVGLRRGSDTLNGGRLVIDLNSGVSSVDGRAGGSSSALGTTGSGRGGRVSGSFSVPKKN